MVNLEKNGIKFMEIVVNTLYLCKKVFTNLFLYAIILYIIRHLL